ncbi:MAG: metalloregulator ArsR/SmtB family transcription factor [Cyanobacteria bacterium J06648_11]
MDAIFKALADPTRRELLDVLRRKDGQTLTELESGLEMTRFGVMKHLKLLEDAGLVVSVKRGRFKHHYLNAVPLQEVIDRWIEPLAAKATARTVIDLKRSLEGARPMSNTADNAPDFVHQTMIRTTQDALWDALTRADQVAKYHFACSAAEGDAVEGQPMRMLRADGSTMLTQSTLSLDPKSRIEMTFEPNWFETDNTPSRIVFLIAVEGETCKLTCEHYGIVPGQEGVREGWARHIASLKSWLETGHAIKLAA